MKPAGAVMLIMMRALGVPGLAELVLGLHCLHSSSYTLGAKLTEALPCEVWRALCCEDRMDAG